MDFKLSVITDEVSQSIKTAAEFAKEFSLSAVELRSVNDHGPFDYTKEDENEIKAVLKDCSLSVCCISAPFYKCSLFDKAEIERHIESLKKLAEFSRELGCKIIRGFSFWSEGDFAAAEERIAEQFIKPAEILKDAGMILALEFDPSVYADRAERLSSLLDLINSPQVAALWDAGNGLYAVPPERPFPDGYARLRGRIAHVHLKDAIIKNGKAESAHMCRGEVDYEGQFRALKDDGYDGFLSLETHHRDTHDIPEELLKTPGGSQFSEGGLAASRVSMQNTLDLLKKL